MRQILTISILTFCLSLFSGVIIKVPHPSGAEFNPALIDRTSGTIIGDFTEEAGQEKLFDGITSQTHSEGARSVPYAPGYAGKDWGSGVTKRIGYAIAYSPSNYDFTAGGTSGCTITIQVSNNGSDWTDAGSSVASMTNAEELTITCTNSGGYRYVRLKFQPTGGSYYAFCAEIQFYGQ